MLRAREYYNYRNGRDPGSIGRRRKTYHHPVSHSVKPKYVENQCITLTIAWSRTMDYPNKDVHITKLPGDTILYFRANNHKTDSLSVESNETPRDCIEQHGHEQQTRQGCKGDRDTNIAKGSSHCFAITEGLSTWLISSTHEVRCLLDCQWPTKIRGATWTPRASRPIA